MQRGSRCDQDQNATRIKMQRRSRCNEDQDATRIKMQRGSRCNDDQDATRIKMRQGSRCNEDQDLQDSQVSIWKMQNPHSLLCLVSKQFLCVFFCQFSNSAPCLHRWSSTSTSPTKWSPPSPSSSSLSRELSWSPSYWTLIECQVLNIRKFRLLKI